MKVVLNTILVFLASILTYLGLDVETFTILGYLLFIDYVTGILKARTLSHCISSNKMKYGVVSKFSLVLIPLVIALGAKALQANSDEFLYIGMNILILSEVYSIVGNIYTIRSKEELPEWDAVAALGHRIRTMLIRLSEDKDK
jgi:toxin secretion/phage lysis holin